MKIKLANAKKFANEHRIEIALAVGVTVGVAATLLVKKQLVVVKLPKIRDYTILELTDDMIASLKNDPGSHHIFQNINAGHAAIEYVPS